MFRRPLFLPLVAWILGILVAQGMPHDFLVGAVLLCAGLAGAAVVKDRRVVLVSFPLMLSGLAVLRTLSALQPSPYDLARFAATAESTVQGHSSGDPEVTVVGRLTADPTDYPNRLAFPVQVESASLSDRSFPACGRVQVSLYPPRPASPRASLPPSPAPLLPDLTYGERVRLTGKLRLPAVARNPGELDYRAYLARNGIHCTLSVRAPGGLREIGPAGFSWTGFCLAAKRRMERALRSTLPREQADLMAGLLFSESGRLPKSLLRDFTATGTVHLLSTSGIHVAVLAGVLQLLFGSVRRRHKKPFALFFILMLLAFGVMAGMRPAVARAVLMAAFVYAADLTDRDADGPNLLCLAGLILLVIHPLDLFDMGFQLSFAAVAGLMVLARPIEDMMRRLLRQRPEGERVDEIRVLSASLAVETALWPLLAVHTQQFSILSPLANLIVIPLSGPLIPLGMAQATLSLIWSPMGSAVGLFTSGFATIFTAVVHVLGSIPGALLTVPPPSPSLVAIFYAALIGWAQPWAINATWLTPPVPSPPRYLSPILASLPRSLPRLPRYAALASPLALLLPLLWGFLGPRPPLRITMIDVGQGDCTLIETPDGASMLIDGGGLRGFGQDPAVTFDVGERTVVPFLRREGIRRLDAVLLTHPHDDHVGGLGAVLESVPVRLVLESTETADTAAYRRFRDATEDRHIARRTVQAGDRFTLGRDTRIEVLAPSEPRFTGTRSDLNNNSVVLRLACRGFTALFTGDLEAEAESRLLPQVGHVDLLKVAHHGSRFSTSEAFVERVRPEVALIGVGERNDFGHPNPEVVRRLERSGSRVFRTDRDGQISVETDGNRWRAHAFLSRLKISPKPIGTSENLFSPPIPVR